MPPMVGGIFYEHGHRMAASAVGFLTLVLAVWTGRTEQRRGVRWLAWTALAVVVAQGVLGGLTVLLLLPTSISVAHACLAQTFFCLVIALAYSTSAEWQAGGDGRPEDAQGLRPAAALATGVVFLQLVVGALMRHMGAGLAIPDFPLAFGRLLPPSWSAAVTVHFAHRLGALLATVAIAVLLVRARRAGDTRLSRPALLAAALVAVQLALGATTVLSGKAVLPTTAHVATGAAILGTCWMLTLRAWRLTRPGPGPASLPLAVRDRTASA